MLTDHQNLMLRNTVAAGVVLLAKFQSQKTWGQAITYGAIAYFVMDWAINLRDTTK